MAHRKQALEALQHLQEGPAVNALWWRCLRGKKAGSVGVYCATDTRIRLEGCLSVHTGSELFEKLTH